MMGEPSASPRTRSQVAKACFSSARSMGWIVCNKHRETDDGIVKDAVQMLAEGKQTFRFDTFGSEAFWGGKIRLQPANAAMQPIFVDPDQVQIQGVVVGVMRKY